jgi:hypothetical protein
MENFTIHIFGYGETQINSQDLSVKVLTSTLTTVTPLIEAIFAEKPADNTSTIDGYHAINIFGYTDVRWISKDTEGFSVENDAELVPLINALIVELEATQTNTPAPKSK